MSSECDKLGCIGNENGYCTWSDIPYELPCYDDELKQLTYFENENFTSNILTDFEKEYIKLFVSIVNEGGISNLLGKCNSHEFAMYPFLELLKKIID